MGSIPGPGRFHTAVQLSLCSSACELQQEKPPQWKARVPQLQRSARLLHLEKARTLHEDPVQPKVNERHLLNSR